MIIDFHTHIFPDKISRADARLSFSFLEQVRLQTEYIPDFVIL